MKYISILHKGLQHWQRGINKLQRNLESYKELRKIQKLFYFRGGILRKQNRKFTENLSSGLLELHKKQQQQQVQLQVL